MRIKITFPIPHLTKHGERWASENTHSLQVFRERLSEKAHATTPKGIVGSFECPVLQRNLKELHGRPRTYVCECQRKVKKLVSTATVVRNSVLIISHITFRDCRVHIFSDNLSRNSCIWQYPPRGTGLLFKFCSWSSLTLLFCFF